MTSDERCGWDRPPLQEKEIFKFNAQQYPEEKFYTYVGLARGYTAIGDKEDAIKNWEIALRLKCKSLIYRPTKGAQRLEAGEVENLTTNAQGLREAIS